MKHNTTPKAHLGEICVIRILLCLNTLQHKTQWNVTQHNEMWCNAINWNITDQVVSIYWVVRLVLVPGRLLLSSWVRVINILNSRLKKVEDQKKTWRKLEIMPMCHFDAPEWKLVSAKQPNAIYKITRFLVQDVLVVKDGIGRPHHLGSYLSGLYEGWVRTSSDDLFLSSNTSKSY